MVLAMAHTSARRVRVAVLILTSVGLALATASAQVKAEATLSTPSLYSPQGGWTQPETPAGALARQIRVLATSPKDFLALIGAGKAALSLGDTQAAVGFFGRADEVLPTSPLPQAGLAAAMVIDGDAVGAMPYFARAQGLGATAAMLGVDRGLAYDLLGRHGEAQADYRAALTGSDGDEARRRLALSLAITGDKAGAIAMLGPLVGRGDAGAARCRALVLALAGDLDGARRSLDAAMPGSSAQMAPFLAKLPSLRSDQKAAAVNLGIFPDSGQPNRAPSPSYAPSSSYAYVPQPGAGPLPGALSAPSLSRTVRSQSGTSMAGVMPMSGDRLSSVDQLFRAPGSAEAQPPVQIASIPPRMRSQLPPSAGPSAARARLWVQLASGTNSDALPEQFRRIKKHNSDIFEGLSGYVAEMPDRARLLIGPFKSMADAKIVIDDLESVRVNAFSWTSPPGQTIRKLSAE
jgi:Flp pilus assembly protein TadD